jgi:histidinol dehydrogenase
MKKISAEGLKKVLEVRSKSEENCEKIVRPIIANVEKLGDKALLELTEKFDKIKLNSIKVNSKDLKKAEERFTEKELEVFTRAAYRITRYHEKQLPVSFAEDEQDCKIEFSFTPVKKTGIYIPGGQAPLISTVLMTVIPAKVAGVKEIFVASPPADKNGIEQKVLGLLSYLGIKDVFCIGGAQAAAAFAVGTESVPAVDKIVGPGNKYFNTAKRILFGRVGIDLLAGPSEVVIFTDAAGNADFIEWDLQAQTEHTDGLGILLTTVEEIGKSLSQKVEKGYWLLVKNNIEACDIINFIAPEHLHLICRGQQRLAEKCTAGAIFLGNYSPVVIGDYFAGPSHVLPTGRAARFSSGLSVYDFLVSKAIIKTGRKFLYNNAEHIKYLAQAEGLKAHRKSLEVRLKK